MKEVYGVQSGKITLEIWLGFIGKNYIFGLGGGHQLVHDTESLYTLTQYGCLCSVRCPDQDSSGEDGRFTGRVQDEA